MVTHTDRKRRLTKSGWTARWHDAQPSMIYLDYDGVEYKRSQAVIRYQAGKYGWDWPELVPASVMRAVERLFEQLNKEHDRC